MSVCYLLAALHRKRSQKTHVAGNVYRVSPQLDKLSINVADKVLGLLHKSGRPAKISPKVVQPVIHFTYFFHHHFVCLMSVLNKIRLELLLVDICDIGESQM